MRSSAVSGSGHAGSASQSSWSQGLIDTSAKLSCDIAATTGIHDGAAVVKQLLVGAKVVQVASVLYRQKIPHIAGMLEEIRAWMTGKGYTKLDDFRGKMNQKPVPSEPAEMFPTQVLSGLVIQ